jgi:transcriptional regulator with XRE-family HTH domain
MRRCPRVQEIWPSTFGSRRGKHLAVHVTPIRAQVGVPVERCPGRAPQTVKCTCTVGVMEQRPGLREDVRDFLTSRRAKVTPGQVGLVPGGNRRVPGLRRVEVAMLAGVSVEYYSRLERGNLAGVSEEVLSALSSALELDDAERAHLHDLARASSSSQPAKRRTKTDNIRESLQTILDAIIAAPAVVNNGRGDLVAANALARALYSEMYVQPQQGPVNHARFVFLDQRATSFYRDWSKAADDTVAMLRTEAGRDPYDRALTDLVGELSTRSVEFRTRWAAHNVRQHYTGTKRVHHPVVGDIVLTFEAFDISAESGLTMLIYTAKPGSTHADALSLLTSWAATQDWEADGAVHDMKSNRS